MTDFTTTALAAAQRAFATQADHLVMSGEGVTDDGIRWAVFSIPCCPEPIISIDDRGVVFFPLIGGRS